MYKWRNERGPIAETYSELHGIEYLKAAFQNGCSEYDDEVLLIRTLLQCLELIYLNLSELSDRQENSRRSCKISAATEHTYWHVSLLRISLKYINYATVISQSTQMVNNEKGLKTTARQKYSQSYEALCKGLLDSIETTPEAYHQTPFNSLIDPITAISHNLKLIYQFNEIIDNRYLLVQINFKDGVQINKFLEYDLLETAFNIPKLTGNTFFSQFRLLHQLPELLGMYCLFKINYLRKNAILITANKFLLNLRIVTELIQLINECSAPLLSYLTSFHYHQIRDNLGRTSGSHSEILSERLFKKDYKWLCTEIDQILNRSNLDQEKKIELKRLKAQLSQEVLLWRDFHLGLPRNVLGGFGTKSLIGSDDAVRHAYNLRKNFASDNFDNPLGTSDLQLIPDRQQSDKSSKVLDAKLLGIIAKETKNRFPTVQNRMGPIFGREDETKIIEDKTDE